MHNENEKMKSQKIQNSKCKMNKAKVEKGFLCREVMQVTPSRH